MTPPEAAQPEAAQPEAAQPAAQLIADAYAQFLARKTVTDQPTGIASVPALPEFLFPHQRDIVSWALRRGRSAIFAGTGLGKTAMELVWSDVVSRHTDAPTLIFAPLAVAQQHVREANKFGVSARLVARQSDVGPGINITNYQKIDHFNLTEFGGITLDESSILKSTTGFYRTELINHCASIPFRLAATATPAPNDFMELGNHAEFLGIMSYTDMLATFFSHDGGETQKWRLKGHAENEFWKWMASWAVMLRRPSDLGYDNTGYDLPPLNQFQHLVSSSGGASMETGMLFAMEAQTLQERLAARRDTVAERVAKAASIVTEDFWNKLTANQNGGDDSECLGNQNTKPTDFQKLSVILNMMQSSKHHDLGRQKKTKNICEHTTKQTKTNGSGHQKKKKKETPLGAQSMCQEAGNGARAKVGKNTSSVVGTAQCGQSSELASQNMTPSWQDNVACAQYADPVRQIHEDTGFTLTTATIQASLDACSVAHATSPLESLKTTGIDLAGRLNTSVNPIPDRWVIWCQLNSEQDALERAFGELCLSVRGSNTDEDNEHAIQDFINGVRPILIGKPSMLGFGLNLQCCNNTLFVGLNDSFEQVFQAVRRFWRFGQDKPVNAHFVAADTEGAVVANLRRKEADAERMAASMVMHTASISKSIIRGQVRDKPLYDPQVAMEIPEWIGA